MCGEKPCFNSVCGISLWKFVIFMGFCQLGITIIAISYLAYRLSQGDFSLGLGLAVDIVVLVLDFMVGVKLSMLLIIGAKLSEDDWNICICISKSNYLICWIITTIFFCVFDVILMVLMIKNNEWKWDPSDIKVDI